MRVRNRDVRFFAKAREAAECSDYTRHKVGCVVTYGDRVLASGSNGQKTSPAQKHYNRKRGWDDTWVDKVHAEMNALGKCRHMELDWSRASLYVYRICGSRPYGMARPCRACMAAIRDFGIRRIHYTTDVGFAYEVME